MKYFIIILALILTLPQVSIEQSSATKRKRIASQKEEKPSPRQLDFMQRLQYDMRHPFDCVTFVVKAYGDNHQAALQERVNEGLTNPRNLVDIIRYAKLGETERMAYEMHVFPSLTKVEREHFLSLSNKDLEAAANKYAKWMKHEIQLQKQAQKEWESQPEY